MARNFQADARYWPDKDDIDVTCPWCKSIFSSWIGSVREYRDPGRLDQCRSCFRDVIIEATADGVVFLQGVEVPDEQFWVDDVDEVAR